jgi:hypothetical protein
MVSVYPLPVEAAWTSTRVSSMLVVHQIREGVSH